MTRIVVDSTCDLPADLMRELNIIMVPLKVHFGDEVFRDKVDLDEDKFFAKLSQAPKLPTTSQPSPGDFLEAYGSVADGDPIVSIHIAEQLSGTIQSARIAAEQLKGREIRCVDTGSVSWAAGLLILAAAEAVKAGRSAAEVEQVVNDLKPRLRLIAILDTLEYVIKGGRVSRAQGMIGSMLRIKPMMLVKDGMIERMSPARTWGQAYDKVVDDIKQHGGPERIAVIQAQAADAAATISQKLESNFPGVEVYQGTIGPVVGTHAGPGAAGVAYLARQP